MSVSKLSNFQNRLLYSLVISVVILFIIITLNFILFKLLPGDPVLATLPGSFSPAEYTAAYEDLGFHLPIFMQYFIYLGKLFSGNLGVSYTLGANPIVSQILAERFFRSFDILFLPVLIGLVLGTLFGYLSSKIRKKWADRIIQLLLSLGLCVPVYLMGLLYQYTFAYQLNLFPSVGYKDSAFGTPPFVIGSRIFDSLLSGNLNFIGDYIDHLILPMIIMTYFTSLLITRQIRSNLRNNPDDKSFMSNVLKLGFNFGIIFTMGFLVEIIFNFHGLFEAIFSAILYSDFFLFSGALFLIIMSFVVTLFISLFASKLWERFVKTRKAMSESEKFERKKETLVKYFSNRLKSPITILGLVIVLSSVIIAIFPQIVTPYTFLEATGIPGGAWSPPSPDHPLGQTSFGRDVLARLVYGIQSSLTTGFAILVFALVGGVILGGVIIVIKLYSKPTYRWIQYGLITSMILAYIIPAIIVLPYILTFFPNIFIMMMLIGLYLAPCYALVISKTEINREDFKTGLSRIIKRIIAYTPIIFLLFIFIYESFSFITFMGVSVNLSTDMAIARQYIYTAPWASLFPGLALMIYTLGFLLLHFGLKEGFDEKLR